MRRAKNNSIILERVLRRLLEACVANKSLEKSLFDVFAEMSEKGAFQDLSVKFIEENYLDPDARVFVVETIVSKFLKDAVDAMSVECEKSNNSGIQLKGDKIYFSCRDPLTAIPVPQFLVMRLEIESDRISILKNPGIPHKPKPSASSSKATSFKIDPKTGISPEDLELQGSVIHSSFLVNPKTIVTIMLGEKERSMASVKKVAMQDLTIGLISSIFEENEDKVLCRHEPAPYKKSSK